MHRDVSPQNVLVGVDGVARVLDFGIAKAAGRLQVTREGQVKGAHEVKRIAHKLVTLSEVHPELLIATAAGPFPDSDPARRAISTAVFSAGMTRILSQDRGALAAVVQAALLADCGAARWGAVLGRSQLATGTLSLLATIGEFQPASIRRSVIAFEALRLETQVGPVYPQGSPHTVRGSVLSTARRFNELRAPQPGSRGAGLDAAVRKLEAESQHPTHLACVRLLVSALGFYPSGTVVELDTGELALITGVPSTAIDFARPPVHVMTDTRKSLLPKPIELDLARQPDSQPVRAIRNPLDLARARAAQPRG